MLNIEDGATADQTGVEIEAAYNAQVPLVSQAAAVAGTSTTVHRWTPERVKQAIAALAAGVTDGDKGDVTVSATGATWTVDTAALAKAGPEILGTKKASNQGDFRLRGNGGDGTAALQAAIDALPAAGGVIRFQEEDWGSIASPITAGTNNPAYLYLVGEGGAPRLSQGGTGNFKMFDLNGAGATRRRFRLENLHLIGAWDANQSQNADYRGLSATYFDRVDLAGVIAEAFRGMSLTANRCGTAIADGCRVIRSGRDGINFTGSRRVIIRNCHAWHVADDCFVAYASSFASGTCTLATTIGSPTVTATIASASLLAGDVIAFTGDVIVGGLSMKGTWRITEVVSGTQVRFVHFFNAPSTQSTGSIAYEVGMGADTHLHSFEVSNCTLHMGLGIKCFGYPEIVIRNNVLRYPYDRGISVGKASATSEGGVPIRSLVVEGNVIENVVHSEFITGLPSTDHAAIVIRETEFPIDRARIANNVIDNWRTKANATNWSGLKVGTDPLNVGLSQEHRLFWNAGWQDPAFAALGDREPCVGRTAGISITAPNGQDRSAILTLGNSINGHASAQAIVRRGGFANNDAGERVRVDLAAGTTDASLADLSAALGVLTIDAQTVTWATIETRVGPVLADGSSRGSGAKFGIRFRRPGGSIIESTPGTPITLVHPKVTSSGATTDTTGTLIATDYKIRRKVEVVPYGYNADNVAQTGVDLQRACLLTYESVDPVVSIESLDALIRSNPIALRVAGMTASADSDGGATIDASNVPVVEIAVNTTLAKLLHQGKRLVCTTAVTLTVNAVTDFDLWRTCIIEARGGNVTVAASGAVVNTANGQGLVIPRYTSAILTSSGTDAYDLEGAMA